MGDELRVFRRLIGDQQYFLYIILCKIYNLRQPFTGTTVMKTKLSTNHGYAEASHTCL
jgi:hypothetical protein